MSITDELREYALGWDERNRVRRDLTAIADRIDAAVDGMIELPKDADGEPIHVGDKVTCARSVWQVTGLRLTGLAWGVCCTIFNDHGGSGTNVYPPCDLRHYHAPNVEDVLREFADEMNQNLGMYMGEAIDADEWRDADAKTVEKYAAKLRLAEGED